jgi:hypothetical protein
MPTFLEPHITQRTGEHMQTLQLMDERHKAYQVAVLGNFQSDGDTKRWREANRAYVLARDAAQKGKRNLLHRAA